MRKLILGLFVMTLLSGCVPIPTAQMKVTAPEIRGRVIACGTGDPISGVKVYFEGREDMFALSGADGRFVLPRQRDLVLLKVFTPCPVIDYPAPRRLPGAVALRKHGWKTKSIQLLPYYGELSRRPRAKGNSNWKGSPWEDATVELGDTQLKEEPNPSLEPTRVLGTSAAEQPRVPSTRVAHL